MGRDSGQGKGLGFLFNVLVAMLSTVIRSLPMATHYLAGILLHTFSYDYLPAESLQSSAYKYLLLIMFFVITYSEY